MRALDENFVYQALSLDPVSATSQGYHEHHGVDLDELWPDYSTLGLRRAKEFFSRSLGDVNRLASQHLRTQETADLDVIRLACQWELLDLDRIQTYRHNPTLYVESIGNGLYSPFILDYAPEHERLARITARIEKIPAFLDSAKHNLVDSPPIWSQVAIEENQGNLDLIEHTIREKIPVALKRRYDHAANDALTALQAFDAFLKDDLSKHTADWRLGPDLYAQKFALALATGDQPRQALADAETKLRSIRDDMHRQAVDLYPKFFPGRKPPEDLNTVVRQVLDRIAQEHVTAAGYFDAAKRDLAETTAFVRDHHLLALPQGFQLEVIPTPEFMRGIYSVGGFSAAPAFEPRLRSFYWITPFTPGMSQERVESKLREYNRYGLEILTIHEAMPGHYVQFEYSDQVEPQWRKLLRAVNSNTPYGEGWAVYATQMMIEEGFDDTPAMRLTFGKQMLRVVANTILDIKLHTMGMTDQQALDLMIEDTFQEKEEAEKKLQRAKLSSCQLPAYFVGWRGWDRLREQYRAQAGANYRLAEFNERALKQGAIPLPILAKIVLNQPVGAGMPIEESPSK